jgi:hypothetical protein
MWTKNQDSIIMLPNDNHEFVPLPEDKNGTIGGPPANTLS